jgi:ABC-type multidrug transport system ATPase subunit
MLNDSAIVVEGLVKRFGDVEALTGVDFEVQRGTIFGLLGPNGAGKTTAVRILATVLAPDAGRAEILGYDVVRNPEDVRMRIGLAGQNAAVDPNLTGMENLQLIGRLAQVEPSAIDGRGRELLAHFDLTDAAGRPVRTYSGGMRRRLDVAASLVQEPPVLFLDEPTTGLDLQSRLVLWQTIRTLVDQGTTVILTTQYLEEADQLGGAVIEMVMQADDEVRRAVSIIGPIVGTEPEVDGRTLRVPSPDGSHLLAQMLRQLDDEAVLPATLSLREPSLDDVFLALTGHAAEDATSEGGGGR